MSGREFRRITDPSTIGCLHRDILTVCFPREELCTQAELVDAVADGRALVWAAVEDDEARGVAVVEDHGVPDVALLAWLAVRPGARSAGLGRDLLRVVLADEAARGTEILLGEIEDPAGAPSEAYGDPAARARFYAAFGGRALLVPHEQPAMAPGLPPVPLLLMRLPLPGQSAEPLPARPVLSWLMRYRGLASGSRVASHLTEVLAGGHVPLGDLTAESFALSRSFAERFEQ